MPLKSLCNLFDAPVSYRAATPEMYEEELFQGEIELLRGAVASRRREFAAGRAAARQALGDFGLPPGPILAHSDRSPHWPTDFVGSISHCANYCAAVVGQKSQIRGLGLDVEPDSPLPYEILNLVCRYDERINFSTLKGDPGAWAKLTFCAKEAFYKCYYPITGSFLDFLDVSVCFTQVCENGSGTFSVILRDASKPAFPNGFHLSGRWFAARGLIFAGATLSDAKAVKSPCNSDKNSSR
jgi:4'-phosphopantetheinyl transferase EntD